MQGIVKARLVSFIAGIVFVAVVTPIVIFFARGYRPDLQTGKISITGVLTIQSFPDNAQVYINSQLQNLVTEGDINLLPGSYLVEVRKEGYQSWSKHITIHQEIVTSLNARLFPTIPTLKAVSSQGASIPTLSPDGTKVAYVSKNNQIYLLDLNESPLGILNRDAKLISTLPQPILSTSQIIWSPDARQLLLTHLAPSTSSTDSAYLIDISNQTYTIATTNISNLLDTWNTRTKTKEDQKLAALPLPLQEIVSSSAANLIWSPDENKLLYTATASAEIPFPLKRQLPGSSTQTQNRLLTTGKVYVYDLEEDRNFEITLDHLLPSPTPTTVSKKSLKVSPLTKTTTYVQNAIHPSGWKWFPTSSHLYRVEKDRITIIEYDNQNPTTVYSGPLSDAIALPYPSGKQMLLLTVINPSPQAAAISLPNLYALSLK